MAQLPTKATGTSWWYDRGRRNRVALVAFAAIVLGGMLLTAVSNYLLAGDRRVLVVTMAQDAGPAQRDNLKQACGSLPGVRVLPDRGNPDPRVQGRFPVRFAIGGSSPNQEAALQACVNNQPGVRGLLNENDGR